MLHTKIQRILKRVPQKRLMKIVDSPTLLEQEDLIRKFLGSQGITKSQDKEKILIRYLAKTELLYRFELLYNAIWGSQVYTLEHLKTTSPVVYTSIHYLKQGGASLDLYGCHKDRIWRFKH